ncbi:MAG: START domain-containing protein [Saprospiraceae bacterium]
MKKLLLLFIYCTTMSLSAQSDWQLARNENGIKVWTKDVADSNFKQFKAETNIKADLENIVAVFLDIENMHLWYDRIKSIQKVEKISDTEGVYIINFDLPWPVAQRVTAVKATINYNPQNNTVTVLSKYEKGIIDDTDKVLITNIHSSWIITPLSNGTVDVFHVGYMDPEGILPAWITNKGLKDGPISTFNRLIEILPSYSDVTVGILH